MAGELTSTKLVPVEEALQKFSIFTNKLEALVPTRFSICQRFAYFENLEILSKKFGAQYLLVPFR